MVVSMGIWADYCLTKRRHAAGALALVVMLSVMIAALPAEARKKIRRSHYSPPSSAMVIDAYSGKILYADKPDQPRFPASVTKVMTLYLLFEQLRDGRLSPDSALKVSASAASRPPSKLDLDPGSQISVRDAMYALVTKSANDVAAVIAENIAGSEAAFARMMTNKARAIGMSNTNFNNASGLPDSGQVTTARDLVTLGRRIMNDFPEESKIFRTRYFDYGEARFKNHNSLLFSYAGMDGMKTGFTQASGFNLLASCHRSDKHLIAVVLGGGSSGQRNARMRSLLDQSWSKAVALNELKQKGQDAPAMVAGVLSPDLLPERNPAFHSDVSERLARVAIAEAGKAEAAKAAERPRATLASLAQTEAAREAEDEDAAEVEEPEEGDTDTTTASADEKTESDQPAAGGPNKAGIVADADAAPLGPYHVQVGSYLDAGSAKERLTTVAGKASRLLNGHGELTVSGEVEGKSYYRARFGKFSREGAASACAKLKRLSIECLVVRVE